MNTSNWKKRVEDATHYWLEKGLTLSKARSLAIEQVDWEDANEEAEWRNKGPNDTNPEYFSL